MQIIPAIDLLDGKCVRLFQGKYEESKIYNENPLSQAKIFEAMGIKRLHMVDLNGAKEGKPVNFDIVRQICSKTSLTVELGGGIRDLDTVKKYFEAGLSKVILGSVLTKDPKIVDDFLSKYPAEKLVAGIDFKNNQVAISGWLEKTTLDPLGFALILKQQGVEEFIFTDISKDGTLAGSNVGFYQKAGKALKSGVIASGGIGSDADIEALLPIAGITGIIVGKAYYENKVDLKKFIQK